MNKLSVVVLMSAVLLAGSAFCANPGRDSRRGLSEDDSESGAGMREGRTRNKRQDHEQLLAQELGLSKEQKERFREHKLEVREELIKLNALRDKARREYEKVMATNDPDEQSALAALDALHKVNADIVRLRVRSKRAVNAMLEQDQLNRLNELRDSLRKRRRKGTDSRRPVRKSPDQEGHRLDDYDDDIGTE